MKNSSASQLDLDYDETPTSKRGSEELSIEWPPRKLNLDTSTSSVTTLSEQSNGPSDVYAATSRIAGRINAASVSETEYEALLEERQKLLDKKLDGTATRREMNKLEYVRWSLDRIEDARHGYILDRLEDSVSRYEDFVAQIQSLKEQMEAHKRRRK